MAPSHVSGNLSATRNGAKRSGPDVSIVSPIAASNAASCTRAVCPTAPGATDRSASTRAVNR